jgi:DNA-binding Xre family transcriptional regulator
MLIFLAYVLKPCIIKKKGGDFMIKYNKLFATLALRGLRKKDLYAIIAPPTLSKIAKNESITTEILNRICSYLNVQPGDIMEYVPDEEQEG